ncbi:hypothetical protein HK101_008449 [Irineochytrium annulatum]|nr:hypothetical protein HK101_008449 [Irineochytrium annulatum]
MFGVRRGIDDAFNSSEDNVAVLSFWPTEGCDSDIIGRFQMLKDLAHPSLCRYIEALKSSNGRMLIISEHPALSLRTYASKQPNEVVTDVGLLRNWCQDIVDGMHYLASAGCYHRNLASKNVMLNEKNRAKLSNYGLFYMTNYGTNVAFPVGYPEYLAPEVLRWGPRPSLLPSSKVSFFASSDVWSLGMLLLELYYGSSVFGPNRTDVAQILEESSPESSEDHLWILKDDATVDPDLKSFITSCLTFDLTTRPSFDELASHPFLSNPDTSDGPTPPRIPHTRPPLASSKPRPAGDHIELSLNQSFHLWRINGSDVEAELRKQGFTTIPSIHRLPALFRVDEDVDGCLSVVSDAVRVFEDRFYAFSLEQLWADLREGRAPTVEDLQVWKEFPRWSEEWVEGLGAAGEAQVPRVSIAMKEKDVGYQYKRIKVFHQLLLEFPLSIHEIIDEARVDVPPLLRGKIWAAILGIKGDPELIYSTLDKVSEATIDRQLELDIPRCHQYNELLSSKEGHRKLRRILKAWSEAESNKLVYWQGLDSVLAPFLTLSFNHEALAFASFRTFVNRFLSRFYVTDNSVVMRDYMTTFAHVIAFLDPALAIHFQGMGLTPELFAIPWFMTMFALHSGLDSGLDAAPAAKRRKHGGVGMIGAADFKALRAHALVLDTRDALSFSKAHFPHSISVLANQIDAAMVLLKIMAQRARYVVVVSAVNDVDDAATDAGAQSPQAGGGATVAEELLKTKGVVMFEVGADVAALKDVEPYLCRCTPTASPSNNFAKCNNNM